MDIRQKITNNFIYVSIDETNEIEGHDIGCVIVAILDENLTECVKPYSFKYDFTTA